MWPKTTFNNLLDFADRILPGLAIGNAPRRCHNCGRYFADRRLQHLLLQQHCAGRDGAHLPEGGRSPKGGAGHNRTPAQVEYDRTYNRLKQRKNRKKISIDEWNIAVAKAQELMEQAGRGELTDTELKGN